SPKKRRALHAGDRVDAIVVQVGKDSVFVEVDGHAQAFFEAAELRDAHITLSVGDKVSANVVDVDTAQGLARLGRPRALTGATLAEAPPGAVAVASGPVVEAGVVVNAIVDKIETFGVFVQIEGTSGRSGRGLIPQAELGVARGTDLRKTFPVGTKVVAKILEVAPDGKIRMSVKGAKDAEERADFEASKSKAAAPATLGTFADLLKKKK
ncbi:MAG: S1 RNA-binding domain-containing protein, partial [Polyangiaceae bacterium]